MENFEPNPPTNVVEEGKTIAIISYLTLIGLVIAFVMNNDKKNSFAAFHIRQAIGIMLTGVVLGFVNIIPVLGWIVFIIGWVFIVILWITGLLNALNGKEKPVMVLGEKFNEWFASVK
ncbi:MAG TPA: DUF4870 domain-containing protein [Sphingobacterium sp.]|nr:DUF4870 domain-containing protein [Sphingobacterium sp.]